MKLKNAIKLIEVRKIIASFIVLFALNCCVGFWLANKHNCISDETNDSFWSVHSGDTFSYLQGAENFFLEGEYYSEHEGKKSSASRPPHYGIPYIVFRSFASPSNSFDLLILYQLVFVTIAMILIGIIASSINSLKLSYYLTLLISFLFFHYTFSAIQLVPESLASSMLVISVFFFIYYLDNKSITMLLLSGFFLSYAVVLRPYLGIIYPVVGFYFLPKNFSLTLKSLQGSLISTSVFSIGLIILLSPWVIRNYQVYDRFVPFQEDFYAGYHINDSYLAMIDFVNCWGSSTYFWQEGQAGTFFIDSHNYDYTFPDYAFTSKYNLEDLKSLKTKYNDAVGNNDLALDKEVADEFKYYTAVYKKERPFIYYFYSRLMFIKEFVLPHKYGPYLPFNEFASNCPNKYDKYLFLSQGLLYFAVIITGFIGCFYYFFKRKYIFILGIIFVTFCFFPIIYKSSMHKYFVHLYPYLLIGSSLFISKFIFFIKNKVKILI